MAIPLSSAASQSEQEILVLVPFPITSQLTSQLRTRLLGRITHLSLSELRRLSPLELVAFLFRKKPDRLVIPAMDENAASLMPILLLVAGFSRASSIECVDRDFSVRKFNRFAIFVSVLRFGYASVRGLAVALMTWILARWLVKSPRQEVVASSRNEVLYVKTNLWFGVKAGGSVGHIAGVVNGFLRKGFRVRFASAEKPAMVSPRGTIHKIFPQLSFGVPYEFNNYVFQSRFLDQLRELDLSTVGLIYQRLSQCNFLGVLVARHLRVPLIVEYNGSEVWIAANWGRKLIFHKLALLAEEVCLRHAHMIVTVSEPLKRELIARGIESERVVCYPNCIDPEIFDPQRFSIEQRFAVRKSQSIPSDATLITFVGTFGEWHGVTFLAEAIRELVEKDTAWLVANKIHFMLVGDGLKMPEVKAVLDPIASSGFFTLTGLIPQDEAPSYLAASDILVSPHVPNKDGSEFFGSPTKLFEYMAMERAIVASSLGQIADVLSPGITWDQAAKGETGSATALLFEPGNLAEFLKALRLCAEDKSLRSSLATNARVRALTLYTWDQHVKSILEGAANLGLVSDVPAPSAPARSSHENNHYAG